MQNSVTAPRTPGATADSAAARPAASPVEPTFASARPWWARVSIEHTATIASARRSFRQAGAVCAIKSSVGTTTKVSCDPGVPARRIPTSVLPVPHAATYKPRVPGRCRCRTARSCPFCWSGRMVTRLAAGSGLAGLAGLAGLIRAILPGCREAKVPGRGGSAQCERAQFRGSGLGSLLQVPDLWCCPICSGSRPVAFRAPTSSLLSWR